MDQSIHFYFSLLSPWSYLGYPEVVRISKTYNVPIVYKPINLSNMFSEMGGLPLSKRHPSRQKYRLTELNRWKKRRNIPINTSPKFFPFDANLANCIVISLIERNIDPEQFIVKAFEATWQNDQNLADPNILHALLIALNLPADELISAGNSEGIKTLYDLNFTESVANGVFGVPFVIYNNEPFWGQDRLDFLEEAIAENLKN